MQFNYIPNVSPDFCESLHNKPISIWSYGEHTVLIEFKKKEDSEIVKQNIGSRFIFVDHDSIH